LATVLGLDDSKTDAYMTRAANSTVPLSRDILGEQHVKAETFIALKLIQKKLNVLQTMPDALSSIS
jgi:hypothetical protein